MPLRGSCYHRQASCPTLTADQRKSRAPDLSPEFSPAQAASRVSPTLPLAIRKASGYEQLGSRWRSASKPQAHGQDLLNEQVWVSAQFCEVFPPPWRLAYVHYSCQIRMTWRGSHFKHLQNTLVAMNLPRQNTDESQRLLRCVQILSGPFQKGEEPEY